jgi:hypothetical protein
VPQTATHLASPNAVLEEILAIATQLSNPSDLPQGYDSLSRKTRKYKKWRN